MSNLDSNMNSSECITNAEDGKNDVGRVCADPDLLANSARKSMVPEVQDMDEHRHMQSRDESLEGKKEALVSEVLVAKDIKGMMLVDTNETKASINVAVSDSSGSRTVQPLSSKEPVMDKQGHHQKENEGRRHNSSDKVSESDRNIKVVNRSNQDPDSGKHHQSKNLTGQQQVPSIVQVEYPPWDDTTVLTKCLIFGQKKVGKTSLIAVLKGEPFVEVPQPRSINHFESMEFRVRDLGSSTCRNVVLDIIEIGAEMPKEALPCYFVGISFVVLVTDATTFSSEVAGPGTQKTLSEFLEYIEPYYKGSQIGIIENKNDEVTEEPVAETRYQSGRQKKWEHKWCMHTSCKTGAMKIRTDVKTWLQRNAVYGYLQSNRNKLTLGNDWIVED